MNDKPSNSIKIYTGENIINHRINLWETKFILLSEHEKEIKAKNDFIKGMSLGVECLHSEITKLQSQLKAEQEKNEKFIEELFHINNSGKFGRDRLINELIQQSKSDGK